MEPTAFVRYSWLCALFLAFLFLYANLTHRVVNGWLGVGLMSRLQCSNAILFLLTFCGLATAEMLVRKAELHVRCRGNIQRYIPITVNQTAPFQTRNI